MPRQSGASCKLSLQKESVYGTSPSSPNLILIPFLSESIQANQAGLQDDTITSSRVQKMPVPGNIDVAGSINCNLSETGTAHLLAAAFGSFTPSGATDPYTHTLKPGTLPSLTIQKDYTDLTKYELINGCKVSKMSFSLSQNGFVTCNFDIKGKTSTISGTSFDSSITEYSSVSAYSDYHASITEGGSSIATVKSISFEMDNDLDDSGYFIGNSGVRTDLPEGKVKVSGTLVAAFDGTTLIDKAIASTETSIIIALSKGTTPARSCTFTIPELKYERTSPVISGSKGLEVSLKFNAYYDDNADGTSIKCVLVNGIAALLP